MGIEPERKPFERLPFLPELEGPPSFPTSSLEALSAINSAQREASVQLRFIPDDSHVAAAAAQLILEGNRYRNKKHLDQAILSSKHNYSALFNVGTDLARAIAVPDTIRDHLALVFDSFFFSDDLDGKLTPNQEERALFSELYQEANRTGATQTFWGANPCLDAAINDLAKHFNHALSPFMIGRSPTESLPLCFLMGLLIRPLARHFLAETFGAEAKPAKEEGSVGNAALDIAKTVIYKVLVDQRLLGQTPDEISAQLRQLANVDIRTTYITAEFPPGYATLLVHLSYVALDLHSLLVDWRAVLQMSGFLHHPATSKMEGNNPGNFTEAAIPLTAIGVLHLHPAYEGARGVLLQGKVRGGVCCLTKGSGSGIVFKDVVVDATRSWSLPEALCISIDSAGKIFGSHEGRLSTIASEAGASERVREVAHALHQEAKDELERLWLTHPLLFHFIDRLPFSLLLKDNERRVLLYPELGLTESPEAEVRGKSLTPEQVNELLSRIGLETSYLLKGLELETIVKPSDEAGAPCATSHQTLSEYFLRHGNRSYSRIFSTLNNHYGVEEHERRGKGSHSLLMRNGRGFPLPHSIRDSTEPFPLSYLKPLLRHFQIPEADFIDAMERART